jgi:hypothetical protein
MFFIQRYIVAFLSFVRYLSVLHKTSWLNRLLEQHRDLNVLCCGLLAFCWAFPPLIGLGNNFVREGAGFYCSLDWNNSSIQSRIFLISLIIFNYVIPFILLVYSNLRVYCILRSLLKSRENFFLPKVFSLSKSSYLSLQIDLRKCLSDARLKETTNRLQRLKIDRRYAFMTAIISIQYLIAWTPYASIELLNLTGRSIFIQRNPFLPTFCALLAKMSLILNPIILIYTSKMTKA